MKIVLSICFLFIAYVVTGQNGDCASAITICKKTTLTIDSIKGAGVDKNEITIQNAPCFGNVSPQIEYNSLWIRWQVAQAGTLSFTINPKNYYDDIDFIVFRLDSNKCSSKITVRCMASGDGSNGSPTGCSLLGATGLRSGEIDSSESGGCLIFYPQNNFLAPLSMRAGESYALWINNFSSTRGVSISFCGTALLGCETSNNNPSCFQEPIVKGTVFLDTNKDSIRNTNEMGIPNIIVKADTGYIKVSDRLGDYVLPVYPNKSSTFYPINLNRTDVKIVPLKRTLRTDDSSAQVYDRQDFAVQVLRVGSNLRTNIVAANARPGFNAYAFVSYQNIGTTPLDGTIALTLDSNQTYINADKLPNSQANKVVNWTFANLQPFEQAQIRVEVKTALTTPLGSTVTSKVVGTTAQIDVDTSDNTQITTIVARGAYDPNDINVDKTKVKTVGQIVLTPLSYTIRFQNTGNAPASKVEVIDTLPVKLDLTSIEMLAASHKYTMQIMDVPPIYTTRIIKWTFDGINLPDSTSNEKGSHGFINFKINTSPKNMGVSIDSIFNKAAIYFDFNPPIFTNTAQTAFGPTVATLDFKDLGLHVFPNPTSGILTINSTHKTLQDLTIDVVNINGQVVKHDILRGQNPQLNIQELATGLYFLKVTTADGTGVVKIVKE
jgi:uncharacterized repeat protein (TIGR01451 family)